MAQVRAGVRLRKALCAVLEHPSVSHRFENTGLTLLEVRMGRDFKKAHVRWTVASADDDDAAAGYGGRPGDTSTRGERKRNAERALKQNAVTLRNMASKMLRSKHTPRLIFVDDDGKKDSERALDVAFDRAEDDARKVEAYVSEVKRREEAYVRDLKAGLVKPGKYDDRGTYPEPGGATRDAAAAAAAADDELKGYAFETYDGSEPYVSDFVDPDETGSDRRFDSDSNDVIRNARVPSEGSECSDDSARREKVRFAASASRPAEDVWLASGSDASGVEYGGFDDAVDALVEEMTWKTPGRTFSVREAAGEFYDGDSARPGARPHDDDDLDEYVDGDAFDDDDDDDEVDDFDFDIFDESSGWKK